jgi:hypothetical protein
MSNHTSRRGLLAGILGAPAAAAANALQANKPTEREPWPQAVTQRELERFRDIELSRDRMAINFRRRLQAGAAVEPGPITIEWDGPDADEYDGQTVGAYVCGVDISWDNRDAPRWETRPVEKEPAPPPVAPPPPLEETALDELDEAAIAQQIRAILRTPPINEDHAEWLTILRRLLNASMRELKKYSPSAAC